MPFFRLQKMQADISDIEDLESAKEEIKRLLDTGVSEHIQSVHNVNNVLPSWEQLFKDMLTHFDGVIEACVEWEKQQFAESAAGGEVHTETTEYEDQPAALAKHGHIKDWDVSGLRDMSYLFLFHENFNDDLSNWDVSAVRDMSYLFHNQATFNKDLSKWDVSKVESMQNMFDGKTCSMAPAASHPICQAGMRLRYVGPVCRRFSVAPAASHPICRVGMCRESPICDGCSWKPATSHPICRAGMCL